MELKIQLLDQSLYDFYNGHKHAYPDDGGIDLFVSEDTIVPGKALGFMIPLNIRLELVKNDVTVSYFLVARSSMVKTPLRLCSVGIIDAGFRGSMFFFVDNHSDSDYLVTKGTRLIQLCVGSLEHITVTIVSELSKGSRGNNGIGSSGTCGYHSISKL